MNRPFDPDDTLTVATRFFDDFLSFFCCCFLRRRLPEDAPHHFATGRKAWKLKSCFQISYFLLPSWHFSPLLRAKMLFMWKNGHPVCGTRSAGGPAAHLSELMTQQSVTLCSQPPRTAHPTSFCHPCTAPCRPAVHSARARRRIMQPQRVGWGPRRSR